MSEDVYKVFPDNPPYLFLPDATYMVTAASYQKALHMASDERKVELLQALASVLGKEGWRLLAYAVLGNHYHALLQSPARGGQALSTMLASVHKSTARRWNEADHVRVRSVWSNYWDTCLASEGAYFARVNFIHWNPVKHGMVSSPELYQFSSYHVWQERSPDELQRIEKAYPFDRVKAYDDF